MPDAPPRETASPAPAGGFVVPKATSRRVKIVDRLGGWVIRFGGVSVIAAVAAIFVFVGREALPLFRGAEARRFIQAPAPVCAPNAPVMGVDEYETCAFWLDPAGVFRLTTLDGLKPAGELPVPQLQKHPLASGYRSPARNHLYLGTRDGHVLLAQLKFNPAYTASGRVVTAALNEEALVEVSPSGSAVEKVFGRHDGTAAVFAALCADGKIYSGRWEEGEDAKVEEVRGELAGRVTHLAIDGQGRKLFAATDDGRLHLWYLEKSAEKPFRVHELGAGRAITAMDWAIGDNALLLGFRDGAIEQWFGVREQRNEVLRSFRKIRAFDPLPAAVTALAPSGRDKGFVAGARDGTVRLCFTTSGRTLLSLEAGGEVSALCYAPKLTSVLAGTTAGRATGWAIDNPHPEISWQTLFGKVWYEGYDAPEYNWQSTGGSDDFESKFSLVPLVVGTLKGAFYGLLFAIPVAVMAAIYVAQFMHLQLRTLVKPTVEIMAALPSVVIGFLAGLWLAPLMERQFLSVLAMFVLVPVLVLVAVSVWHHLPVRLTQRVPHGMELALIVPLIAAASAVAARLGPGIDGWFFHGDFRQWVFNTFGEQFEQRNSIVIGFAMGFAVIPIIFTIAEDALSNVPQHFVSGSLALGASRWQTAVHIVLPTASPGIFSAIMVGFGRAVGETMIVLMATGNTPILSFSPFNGMRTLSANIAVEIPEAPVGGTLYRVLFLAAILLFVLTFVVNTAADIIRQRLREKYKAV